jgi:copper homeostasis protein
MDTLAVEIAVTTSAGSAIAAAEGADRVELCSALELGGLTPSIAAVHRAVTTGIPVHALIRNRPGDFVYDEDDVRTMMDDTAMLVEAGASGVVIGALAPSGGIDVETVLRLAGMARATNPAVQLTFHRAIDRTPDPAAHLVDLAEMGFDRVLTSGGASRALDGDGVLRRMVAAGSGVEIMAGGGVLPEHVARLAALGVDAVHLSAKARAAASTAHWVSLGSASTDASADAHFVTDGSVVRAAVVAARDQPSRPSR